MDAVGCGADALCAEMPKSLSITEMGEERTMSESRVVLMGIIVEDAEAANRINGLLHEYGSFIIGRMGIPYREKGMNIISIVLDAPQEKVSALSGKLGMIPGVSSKCLYAGK